MQMGGGSPGDFGSALCMRDASLARSSKSLALAGLQGNLGISAAARQMRRLCGPCGGIARQDVSAAVGVDANSTDGDHFVAWDARRETKKRNGEAKRRKVGRKNLKV